MLLVATSGGAENSRGPRFSATGLLQPWCYGFGGEWFDAPFNGGPLYENYCNLYVKSKQLLKYVEVVEAFDGTCFSQRCEHSCLCLVSIMGIDCTTI